MGLLDLIQVDDRVSYERAHTLSQYLTDGRVKLSKRRKHARRRLTASVNCPPSSKLSTQYRFEYVSDRSAPGIQHKDVPNVTRSSTDQSRNGMSVVVFTHVDRYPISFVSPVPTRDPISLRERKRKGGAPVNKKLTKHASRHQTRTQLKPSPTQSFQHP